MFSVRIFQSHFAPNSGEVKSCEAFMLILTPLNWMQICGVETIAGSLNGADSCGESHTSKPEEAIILADAVLSSPSVV